MNDDNGNLGLALVLVVVICLGIFALIVGDESQKIKNTDELKKFNSLTPPIILVGENSRRKEIMLRSKEGVLILSNSSLTDMLSRSYTVGDTIIK